MKIIVNAAGYVGQSSGAGGAGVFLQYLVGELAKHCAVDVLVAPNSKNFQTKQRGARFIELPYLTAETLRHLRNGPTAVIDPFGALPCLPFPEDMALCVVVHDLMHLEQPHFFTEAEKLGRSWSFAGGLQRADAVVTFSADQARAIRRFYPGTSPIVIPHLPYAGLRDAPLSEPTPDISAYQPFVLFPAVKWPHKNHRTVIEAFGSYVCKTGSKLRLLLCGGPCAESRFSFYPADRLISEQVDDLGLVSEPMLRALFAGASAVLFPTLYEGFGIPVLEAAYLGKMVVASRLAVFDEILGPQGYRAIESPLCHLRWMEALAEVESPAQAAYETQTRTVREQVDPARFANQFSSVLTTIADRYTHPALYPTRVFPSGDRATSSVSTALTFSDIHATATFERGARQASLGEKTQPSTVFRSADAAPDRQVCLRAQYGIAAPEAGTTLMFSAWMRLQVSAGIDLLRWSVNDGYVTDLLDELSDGEWHLVRHDVPPAGYIDLRAVRSGRSEVPGFDLELHDPCILNIAPMPIPDADPPVTGLTVVVSAFSPSSDLAAIATGIDEINRAVKMAKARLNWIVVTSVPLVGGVSAQELPTNVRVQVLADIASIQPIEEVSFRISACDRTKIAGLISPYEPVDKLLLLEDRDLQACLDPENLETLAVSLGPGGAATPRALTLCASPGFWSEDERGRIMAAGHRVGQPIPLLDPEVVRVLLDARAPRTRPRFAVIETDLTSSISHHSVVSGLFLDGAEACGFEKVLGINRAAKAVENEDFKIWSGFTNQVYAPGTADDFAEELAAFVAAQKLGPNDVIFMHSLSPQIVLGAARFLAAAGGAAPRVAMRFFSTAEAMGGHKLSYTKIVRSVLAVGAVRERMHFFCESENLIAYYEKAVGVRFPLLLNPEHPSLAAVRRSSWFDPGLGGGQAPTLAYFGEARAEKGFDLLPSILADLLADPAMDAFHFVIQTGSNSVNQTPEMAQAKEALLALRARHPQRLKTFESAETPEAFYFMMKHARGVIAPYRPESYGIRGTGVTLEALQMGLDVFAWMETDLYATFRRTGRVVGVSSTETFAEVIARHYGGPAPTIEADVEPLRQTSEAVCRRMLSQCASPLPESASPPILWVGNDTFGEGCSAVYTSQKRALHEIGRDCFELFVPWPDRNWRAVHAGAYDEKIYGFDSDYEGSGLAWVARPNFTAELDAILDAVEGSGPTYARLRDLNSYMVMPKSLQRAIAANQVTQTLLNYVHLYPVVEGKMPLDGLVCETHDIVSYQHAVRRGGAVSLTEKIDEFSDMSQFQNIVAISAAEQRELQSACPASDVFWQLPPYVPEAPIVHPSARLIHAEELQEYKEIPDAVARPSPLMLGVYHSRPDLQGIFELATKPGRLAFFRWWVFFGQFESVGRFGFTKRQYDWLVTKPGASGVGGLLILMLSARADLRTAFMQSDTIDVFAFEAWAAENARREFGFDQNDLTAAGELHFNRMQLDQSDEASAFDAVLAASPAGMGEATGEQHSLFERISELKTIDMVLVGSSHPANIESFQWFVKQVYLPYLAPSGRSLFVVGSACAQLQQHRHRNLVLLGRCQLVEPLLRASVTCPLPIIAGSGSPIKTIPALATNGAVTVTEHVAKAFGLLDYGIPAFSDPKAFAEDLNGLLTNDQFRRERVGASRRYVESGSP